MTGGQMTKVRKKKGKVPIAIIPTKVVPKQQLAVLTRALKGVGTAIGGLQKYADSISIKKALPTDPQYNAYVDGACNKLKHDVKQLYRKIGALPLVGHRFGSYAKWLEDTIEKARRLAKSSEKGALSKFVTTLAIVKKQLEAIGRVLALQEDMLKKGIPQNVKVGDAHDPFGWVLDSLARVIRTVGTKNEGLYTAAIRAAEIYIQNADIYNTDNLKVRRERDELFKFIIDRGDRAYELSKPGSRKRYTAKDAAEDNLLLRSFQRNAKTLKRQLKSYNITVLTDWLAAVSLKLKDTKLEKQTKTSFTELKIGIVRLLTKIGKGEQLSQVEMSELSTRFYRLVHNRPPPLTNTEWLKSLKETATAMRGKGRTVYKGTSQWWGKKALDLLDQDKPNMAALAIAMGTLEASASKVSKTGAKKYISSSSSKSPYWRIRRAVEKGYVFTPGMRASYAKQIELASMLVEADSMAKEFARKGSVARRKLLLSVLTLVRKRMNNGDIPGATRIMQMAQAYGGLMLRYKTRSWVGAKLMDDALRSELLNGKNAQDMFSKGVISHAFSLEVRKARRALRDWSKYGMKTYLQKVDSYLKKIEQFAGVAKLNDARRLLTFVVMYIDSVERLGRRGKKGIIYKVPAADAKSLKGMEDAMAAILAGKPSVSGKGIEKTFLESFHLAQSTYTENNLKQIAQLKGWYPIGKNTIHAAMAVVRSRVKNRQYKLAFILLTYLQEYYGNWAKGKRPGWRYKIAAKGYPKIKGYGVGIEYMLQAIRKEMKAKTPQEHVVAGQLFDRGTAKIADTHELQKMLKKLKAKQKTIPVAIKVYEKNNPNDRALKGGKSLEQLIAIITKTANEGNIKLYNDTIKLFNKRFTLVVTRAKRRKVLDMWYGSLLKIDGGYDDLIKLYTGSKEPKRGQSVSVMRIKGLKLRLKRLITKIFTLRKTPDALVARELLEFVELGKLLKKEARRARAFILISRQITLNGNYHKMLSGGSGPQMVMAKGAIKMAERYLWQALRAAIGGKKGDCERAYKLAIERRRTAMVIYSAKSAGKGSAVRAWKNFLTGKLGQSGRKLRASYDPYVNLQMAAFRKLIQKTPRTGDLVLGEKMMQMARAAEVSVYAIPSSNLSQQFSSSLQTNQSAILALASMTFNAHKNGYLTVAFIDRHLKVAQTTWKSLQARAQKNQKIGNYVATVGALLLTLFPPTSLLGGAIFTVMAWDRVATEYSMKGKASGESWFWLGFTVVTLGFAGTASIFRTWGTSAKTLGATNAGKLLMTARVFEYITLGLGIGFAAYAMPTAYKAWKKGEHFDAIFLAGLALFPFALMGGAAGWRAMAARRAGKRSQAEMRDVLENALPEHAAVDIGVTGSKRARKGDKVRTREGLLDFLGEFAGKGKRGRQKMLETLPEGMRDTVSALASRKDVLQALKAYRKGGEVKGTADMALRKALKSFEEGPKPEPTGPKGKRSDWETSSWFGEEGHAPFKEFLGDLLVPDGAPAGRLNARAIARARLEALRGANPKAAKIIDGLLRNTAVKDAIGRNVDNMIATRVIDKGRAALKDTVPKKVQSAENQAVGRYQQEVLNVVGGEPVIISRPARPTTAAPRTRASAGQGSKPPTVTPVHVSAGAAAGASTRRGSGQPAAPGGQPHVSVEVQVPPRPGWTARKVGWIKEKWTKHKEAKEAARQKPDDPEALVNQTAAAMDELIATVTSSDNHGVLVGGVGRDAAMAGEHGLMAAKIRTAPDRLGTIVKSIWNRIHDSRTPKNEVGPLWNLLTKIFSHDNVRRTFKSLGEQDAVLAKITSEVDRVTRSAAQSHRDAQGRSDPVPVDVYRGKLSERSFKGDMMLLIKTLEYGNSLKLANVRTEQAALQNVTIPRLQKKIATAEARVAAKTGKAKQRAEATLRELNQKLKQAEANFAELTAQAHEPFNAPLANTERLLGAELTPKHKSAALKQLHEEGAISGWEITIEVNRSSVVAKTKLQNIDTANKPIAKAMKDRVDKSITAEPATSLDDMLLGALRSDEVVNAVSKGQRPKVRELYLEIVNKESATLAEVLEALAKAKIKYEKLGVENPLLSPSNLRQITDFVSSARRDLGGPLTLINELSPVSINNVAGGDVSIAGAGAAVLPIRARLRSFWERAWASWWLRFPTLRWFQKGGETARGTPPTMFTYFARRGIRMWKTPPLTLIRGAKAAGWIALQIGVNVVAGIYAYRLMRWMLKTEPEKVVDRCKEEFGVTCTVDQIKEIQKNPEFFAALSSKVLAGPELRPGSVDSLKRQLESGRWEPNIPKLGKIIDIGKAMRLKLSEINTQIVLYKTGKTQEIKDKAKARLQSILKTWDITIADLDKKLAEKAKYGLPLKLTRTDMLELGKRYLRNKDLITTNKDGIIERFLTDSGVPFKRGQGVSEFLVNNTDVFMFIWKAIQKGNLPRIFIKEAVTALAAPGVIAGIRTKAKQPGSSLEKQLSAYLVTKKLFLSTGIPQGSFLDRLDARAALNLNTAQKAKLVLLFKGYLKDSAAMKKLNGLVIQDHEEAYGDPKEFAAWIIAYKGNVKGITAAAKKLGYVGPKAIYSILGFSSALQKRIVQLVNAQSNNKNQGIMAWIKANYTDITNLPAILKYIAGQDSKGLNPVDYYDSKTKKGSLVRMESIFLKPKNRWMRKLSKREKMAGRRIKREERGDPRLLAKKFQKLSREGKIKMLRSMDKKDKARMIKMFTPVQKQMYEKLPRDVRRPGFKREKPPPPRGAAVPRKIQGPVVHKSAVGKKLLAPHMAKFYKTADGRLLSAYIYRVVVRMWNSSKRTSRRQTMPFRELCIRTYHHAMGSKQKPDKRTIARYVKRKKDVIGYITALVRSDVYHFLTGKKPHGKAGMKGLGFEASSITRSGQIITIDVLTVNKNKMGNELANDRTYRGFIKSFRNLVVQDIMIHTLKRLGGL